ncbi:flagellar motor switch protein FliN [Enterovirga aerilata]|uniref:Flagellar motor switch protein FliN n=1 Tax=Enterovirga aerilata TaxID=2730920 RepID=A0A849I881_9HYPH|nr:flagellar motor switch protein FliN [Enterovirga sp. DB1703]NNM73531.1 flagellar motor switch protein FliN [Enterovirga sp. DB1703]
MTASSDVPLPQLGEGDLAFGSGGRPSDGPVPRDPADLAQILHVPVTLSAVLGHVRVPVGDLLSIGPGAILELDRKVGEAIDILVNDRLVARGEVVLVEDRLGVTMTEIVRPGA